MFDSFDNLWERDLGMLRAGEQWVLFRVQSNLIWWIQEVLHRQESLYRLQSALDKVLSVEVGTMSAHE